MIFSYPNDFSYLNSFKKEEVQRWLDNQGSTVVYNVVWEIHYGMYCIYVLSNVTMHNMHYTYISTWTHICAYGVKKYL